jgi:hypothetical protein
LISGNTGNSISITAPFVLDSPRKGLAPTDKANEYLTKAAGQLIGYLLKAIWIKKFGIDAYELLCIQGTDTTPNFQENAILSLKQSNVILNNKYNPTEAVTESVFCQPKDGCYVPMAEDLYGFIYSGKEVSCYVKDGGVRRFFTDKLGAEQFLIADVASLFCSDHINKWRSAWIKWQFNTREGYLENFNDLDNQKKYFNAFLSHEKELTQDITEKIRRSFAILNSLPSDAPKENKLNSAETMHRWSLEAKNIPKLDLSKITHPELGEHPYIKDVLKIPEFKLNDFIIKILSPEITQMTDDAKIGILEFISVNMKDISPPAVIALKDANIFRTSNNQWCKFDQIVNCEESVKTAFGESLWYPHNSLLTKEFLEIFTFRKIPNEAEITSKVNRLWQNRENVGTDEVIKFQAYLQKRNLTTNTVQQMGSQVLTVDTKGIICLVSGCYENKRELEGFLGSNAHYVDFIDRAYFKQFFASEKAHFDDMLKFISELRDANDKLPIEAEKFYIELADAKKRDIITEKYDQTPIIFIDDDCAAPSSVFIYKKYKQHFFGSKKYWNTPLNKEGRLKLALIELGCKERPTLQDFVELLRWFSSEKSQGKLLSGKWQEAIHWAYQVFAGRFSSRGFR